MKLSEKLNSALAVYIFTRTEHEMVKDQPGMERMNKRANMEAAAIAVAEILAAEQDVKA